MKMPAPTASATEILPMTALLKKKNTVLVYSVENEYLCDMTETTPHRKIPCISVLSV